MNFKRVGCILLYSEPVSFHFCIQCSLFFSQLAQLDDAKAVWRGVKFTWTTAIFRISSLFIFSFFCLIKDDATEKLSYLFQFLVFAFFSPYLCEEILPCEILFWYGIFKTFPQHFIPLSLSLFLFLEKQFSYHVLEFRRKIEKDGGQTWSVFFRKTEINI